MKSPSQLLSTSSTIDANTMMALVSINVIAGILVAYVTNKWFVSKSETVIQVLPEHVSVFDEEIIS